MTPAEAGSAEDAEAARIRDGSDKLGQGGAAATGAHAGENDRVLDSEKVAEGSPEDRPSHGVAPVEM
jgi:hypothetical protein